MALQDISDLLKDVRIEKIIPMDEELGRGAYGRVFTVKYCGLVCAAKEIHPILIEGVSPVERKTLIDNFIRECHRCSVIRHPNIVQFLGVYLSSKKSELPIMVMELMTTSLTSFVRNNQSKIPIKTKISILHDVSLGLSNLHSRNPVVIHRDLSPNNVMLTSQPVAKIGDLGVAKVIGGNSRQTSSKLTTAPGTVDFMPPETLEANPVYGTAVDVFSYAGICLHVFAEKWPTPIGLKRRDPVTKKLMALTEAERRQEYLEKIPGSVGSLKEIFLRCLDDDPEERPAIQEVSEMIKSLIKLHSVDDESPVQTIRSTSVSADILPPPLPPRNRAAKNVSKIAGGQLSKSFPPPVVPYSAHKFSLGCRSKLSKDLPTFAEALQNKCHIKWKSCSDLPCKLYNASVAVSSTGDQVYVTAGAAPDDSTHNNVFFYNTTTDHWTILPQPGHRRGILHMLDDKLTIIGGSDPVTCKFQSKVTTYNSDTNSWYRCYPDMLNKRYMPGVIKYQNYIMVMGGMNSPDSIHDNIEIMDYQNDLIWKIISIKLPVPMWSIKPTISGNSITIVGYTSPRGRSNKCYQIAIEEIVSSFSHQSSTSASVNQWKKLLPALHYDTAIIPYSMLPVSIGGRGHDNQDSVPTSDVTLYDPSKNAWRKVDSLTKARGYVGVGLLNNSSIIVIGGCRGGSDIEGCKALSLTTVEIGTIVHKKKHH